MTLEGILIVCLIGGIAGWLAGLVMKGRGFGILGNIVVGIVIAGGFVGSIINAFIGALIVLFLIGLIKRA